MKRTTWRSSTKDYGYRQAPSFSTRWWCEKTKITELFHLILSCKEANPQTTMVLAWLWILSRGENGWLVTRYRYWHWHYWLPLTNKQTLRIPLRTHPNPALSDRGVSYYIHGQNSHLEHNWYFLIADTLCENITWASTCLAQPLTSELLKLNPN